MTTDRQLSIAARIAAIAAVASFAYIVVNSQPTHFDDAYMFIRYANNLLAGHGHAWNPGGPAVFGSTSLLHVGVVTCLKGCLPGASDATILLVAGAIPATLGMALMVFICSRFSRHPSFAGNWVLWAALLLPVLILQETMKYHLRSGMDTMLSLCCNAVLILATLRLVRRPGAAATALVVAASYLSFLARPDNGIFAVLFPVLCLGLMTTGPRWRRIAVFVAGITAVLCLDFLVKWAVFGAGLPLAFYAKQHGVYRGYMGLALWNPVVYLRTFAGVAMPFLCVLLVCATRRTLPVIVAFLLPVALTFGYYFSINQIMGYEARFYYPALPFVVVAAALTLDDRFRASSPGSLMPRGELLLRLIVAGLVLLFGRQATYTMAQVYEDRFLQATAVDTLGLYTTESHEPLVLQGDVMEQLAGLAADAPPGVVIALSEYGQVGAAAPHVELIDMVGLHDAAFVREGSWSKALFDRRPDVIWFPHRHYTGLVAELLSSDELWAHYDVYPEAFDYGLAIRRDGVYAERLQSLFTDRWHALYGPVDPAAYRARVNR